jgi:hypothetical protein
MFLHTHQATRLPTADPRRIEWAPVEGGRGLARFSENIQTATVYDAARPMSMVCWPASAELRLVRACGEGKRIMWAFWLAAAHIVRHLAGSRGEWVTAIAVFGCTPASGSWSTVPRRGAGAQRIGASPGGLRIS